MRMKSTGSGVTISRELCVGQVGDRGDGEDGGEVVEGWPDAVGVEMRRWGA